ncbi:GGDEF domain-containing protein [Candidatus Woesearchaeota archaeon]|nr:GGDEF domain-containing protein [Candidatus Woesearchaeota archaeon]
MFDNAGYKFNLIKNFSRQLASTPELGQLAKVINNFAVVELGAEHSSIILEGFGKYPHNMQGKTFDDIEEKTFKYVMKVQKCLRIAKPSAEYMFKDIKGISSFGLFMLSLPLITKNQILGSLNLYFKSQVDAEFFDFLEFFSELSSSSIMNSISHKSLEAKSLTDKLTGLYNRRSFDDRIENEIKKCAEAKLPIAVMMMDIDDFKKYNDEKGHQQGDNALAEMGSKLKSSIGESSTAFRYGGEELALIAPGLKPDEALALAEKIRKETASSCRLTISIGLVTCLNSSCPPVTMVSEADKALYRAKKEGKNRVCASVIVDRAINPIDVQAASSLGKPKE